MQSADRPFVPAAGHDFALPLYDPFTRLLGADTLRQELIARAELLPTQHVLDDPDPRALERARRKAARAGIDVRFERGYGDALPFGDATFAHVFSSFMLHHLDPSTQQKLLTEVRRVLEPGGRFHLLDFAHSAHVGHGLFRRLRRRGPQPHVQSEQEIRGMLQRAGFSDVEQGARRRLLWTPVVAYVAWARDAGAASARS
jgi:SAM-dependent methyltransferase